MGNLSSLMSSVSTEWRTPENVLALVREVFGGPVVLDPCTTDDNPVRASFFFTPRVDGLAQPWSGYKNAYVNPPYGRALPAWIGKCAVEAANGVEIIALLPARTDTRLWHRHVIAAQQICFWRGRIKFVGAPASAPFPSAIVYWGQRSEEFRRAFAPHGWTVAAAAGNKNGIIRAAELSGTQNSAVAAGQDDRHSNIGLADAEPRRILGRVAGAGPADGTFRKPQETRRLVIELPDGQWYVGGVGL